MLCLVFVVSTATGDAVVFIIIDAILFALLVKLFLISIFVLLFFFFVAAAVVVGVIVATVDCCYCYR